MNNAAIAGCISRIVYGFQMSRHATYRAIVKKHVTILPREKSDREVEIPKYRHNNQNNMIIVLEYFLALLIRPVRNSRQYMKTNRPAESKIQYG
jgi:hypothetical protein